MKLSATSRFQKAYNKLDVENRQAVKKALLTMAENFKNPSLRIRKLKGHPYIWEASASMDLRITFSIAKPSTIILRNCGHHDPTLKHP